MKMLNVVRKTQTAPLVALTDASLTAAMLQTGLRPDVGIYSIPGYSGMKYRFFINHLVGRVPDARYLEVGSWMGSTLCAAVHGNRVTAVAVDNWSQFGGPKDEFLRNVMAYRTPEADITFLEADFRAIDYTKMNSYNIYLFDGPHEEKDQFDGLVMALPCMDPEFVFIVDDWNWPAVRSGTMKAIRACGLEILYMAEVRTTVDDTHPEASGNGTDWHNGYFIGVLAKPQAQISVPGRSV
jgi:hypothetical protein